MLRASGFAERKVAPERCIIAPSIFSGLLILFVLRQFSFILVYEPLDKVSDLLRVKCDFQNRINLLVGQQQGPQEKRFQHSSSGEDTVIPGFAVKLGFFMFERLELVFVVAELGTIAFSFGLELFNLWVRSIGHDIGLLCF